MPQALFYTILFATAHSILPSIAGGLAISFIYADTLWINTIIELDEISHLFQKTPNIEPCDIALWDEDETLDGVAALVVLEDGKVESYKSFMEKRELGKIKSLYWD